MKFESNFAVVDVKEGREALFEHLKDVDPLGICPVEKRIPVVLTGYIDSVWSDDDGESRDFAMTIEKVETDTINSHEALLTKIAEGWDGKGSFFADYFQPLQAEIKAMRDRRES